MGAVGFIRVPEVKDATQGDLDRSNRGWRLQGDFARSLAVVVGDGDSGGKSLD